MDADADEVRRGSRGVEGGRNHDSESTSSTGYQQLYQQGRRKYAMDDGQMGATYTYDRESNQRDKHDGGQVYVDPDKKCDKNSMLQEMRGERHDMYKRTDNDNTMREGGWAAGYRGHGGSGGKGWGIERNRISKMMMRSNFRRG